MHVLTENWTGKPQARQLILSKALSSLAYMTCKVFSFSLGSESCFLSSSVLKLYRSGFSWISPSLNTDWKETAKPDFPRQKALLLLDELSPFLIWHHSRIFCWCSALAYLFAGALSPVGFWLWLDAVLWLIRNFSYCQGYRVGETFCFKILSVKKKWITLAWGKDLPWQMQPWT